MASFWAGSIARSIGGTKHAYGGIFVTALAAAAPLSDRSSTVCENNEEFRRRHEQLKASRKEVKLKTRVSPDFFFNVDNFWSVSDVILFAQESNHDHRYTQVFLFLCLLPIAI